MKILTLFFACVASRNFARVGAMNDEDRASRASSEIYIHERLGQPHHVSDYPEIHPDIDAWANHRHVHPTRMLDPITNHPNSARKEIRIERVINQRITDWFLLQGELVHHPRIATCNSPHGYAAVDIKGDERYYACLKPFLYHNETINKEHTCGPHIYVASVVRPGMPIIEAELVSREERLDLEARRMLFHGRNQIHYYFRSLGRVHYVMRNNLIADGKLYQYDLPLVDS